MGRNRVEKLRAKSKKFTGVYIEELQDNDKSFYITYKDENNKKVWLKIGKFSEGIREQFCNIKRNEIITKIRLGESVKLKHAKKDKITISTLADDYFGYRIMHSPKSGAHEQRRYKNHIEPIFGSLSVDEISQDKLFEFQNDKTKSHSQKTINIILDLLSTIIEYAIKQEKISLKNPLKKIKRFDIDNERERYLTEDEAKKLLSDTLADDHELYTFCLIALTTGGRIETILAIREFDCDFVHKTVNLKDFKNNSTYKAFLTNDAITAIKKQLADRQAIFTNATQTIQRRISLHLRQFNKKIKVDDRKNRVVIHTLRHTFASHLAIKGTPIFTIQKLMNHSDIKMTMRYAKLAPDSGRDFVEKLFC